MNERLIRTIEVSETIEGDGVVIGMLDAGWEGQTVEVELDLRDALRLVEAIVAVTANVLTTLDGRDTG